LSLFKACLLLILLVSLSACGILNAPDVAATLRVQNTAYLAEATSIVETYSVDQVVIQATALAAETAVADLSSVNRQLILTAQAIIPPTPQRSVGEVAPDASSGTPGAGNSQFINTGVTTFIRESDGCADSFEVQIPQNAPSIYVNTKALSVRGGTIMSVEWLFNTQVVVQETWTVPRDETDFCIWFSLNPSRVPFTPGLWSARLSANGQSIAPEVVFTIVEVMADGS
jgi:hypothetical protein